MIAALDGLAAVTLFVEDLPRTAAFYREVFGLPVVHQDDDATAFRFGSTILNLLRVEAAHELVEPARPSGADAGPRAQFTVRVDDADAVCAQLRAHGVALLNGPVDRPWGLRTAAFADPAGHVWEIAQSREG